MKPNPTRQSKDIPTLIFVHLRLSSDNFILDIIIVIIRIFPFVWKNINILYKTYIQPNQSVQNRFHRGHSYPFFSLINIRIITANLTQSQTIQNLNFRGAIQFPRRQTNKFVLNIGHLYNDFVNCTFGMRLPSVSIKYLADIHDQGQSNLSLCNCITLDLIVCCSRLLNRIVNINHS